MLFLLVVAPWCGHCKNLKQPYSEAAPILLKNDPPIKLANVDCTKEKSICERFQIRGYPSIRIFRGGNPSEYKGPRTRDGIVSYLLKQVGPSAKPVSSRQAIDVLVQAGKPIGFIVAGVFPDETSALAKVFSATSDKFRDNVNFVKPTGVSDVTAYGLPSGATEGIVAFQSFSSTPLVYTGSKTATDLENWLATNAVPPVGPYVESTSWAYSRRSLPILKVITQFPWTNQGQLKYYINRLNPIASKHAGKLAVAMTSPQEANQDAQFYGFTKEPIVAIDSAQGRYKLQGTFDSAASVESFVADFFANKLEKYVRSEPEPAKNDGPVTVVTGKSFESFVEDSTDVFIEFYAPWCGHCKSLAPKYDELGKKLKAELPKVKIGKVDATKNDFPRDRFQVSGYPTLYFKPSGGKPMQYKGAREVKDMFEFIKKNGNNL